MTPTPLQRALQDAPERELAAASRPEEEYFCFRIGDLRLGVPSRNVREVFRAGPLTPLPRAPAFLLGVCGYRGEVFPVMDLLRFFSKGELRLTNRTRLFVGVSDALVSAVAVDQVIGLRRVATGDILPVPLGGDTAAEFLAGLVAPTSGERVSLLDLAKLLVAARSRGVAR